MNAHHDFTAADWNYASVQDAVGHSELKSIDDDFPTFKIDQNDSMDVGPSTSKALTLQEISTNQQNIRQNMVKLPNASLRCKSML